MINFFRSALIVTVALSALTRALGQEPAKDAAKPDAAAVAKWIAQLKSSDFKVRSQAANDLSKLDEVPAALREAIDSGDLETKRRAEAIVASITARLEEKAFRAMLADMHKVEVDRFVRRMVTQENFRGDKEWKVIEAIAKWSIS
jgi:hypothetical protein